MDSRAWSIADFDIGKKIGEGRFGKIFHARERESKCAVVIKCVAKEYIVQQDMVHQVRRELELHYYCRHRNIIRLLAYFWDENQIFLVLEFAEGGNLLEKLRKAPDGRLNEAEALRFTVDLVEGLRFMHARGIAHRDIKPENVLLKKNRAKICDFSWAVQMQENRRQTLCGTLDYLSPEMITGKGHGCAVDMWGLGVLVYELLTGSCPFERPSPSDTCACIADAQYSRPSFVSDEAQDFLNQCLVPDPAARLTAEAAWSHPWIEQGKLLDRNCVSAMVSENVSAAAGGIVSISNSTGSSASMPMAMSQVATASPLRSTDSTVNDVHL